MCHVAKLKQNRGRIEEVDVLVYLFQLLDWS